MRSDARAKAKGAVTSGPVWALILVPRPRCPGPVAFVFSGGSSLGALQVGMRAQTMVVLDTGFP